MSSERNVAAQQEAVHHRCSQDAVVVTQLNLKPAPHTAPTLSHASSYGELRTPCSHLGSLSTHYAVNRFASNSGDEKVSPQHCGLSSVDCCRSAALRHHWEYCLHRMKPTARKSVGESEARGPPRKSTCGSELKLSSSTGGAESGAKNSRKSTGAVGLQSSSRLRAAEQEVKGYARTSVGEHGLKPPARKGVDDHSLKGHARRPSI
eukprot:6190181-Pleurochrysis_carterae.AAC.1